MKKQHFVRIVSAMVIFIFFLPSFVVSSEAIRGSSFGYGSEENPYSRGRNGRSLGHNNDSKEDSFARGVSVIETFRIYIGDSISSEKKGESLIKAVKEAAPNMSEALSDPRHTYEFCRATEHWPKESTYAHGPILFVRTLIGSGECLEGAINRLGVATQLNGGFTFNENHSPVIWSDERTVSMLLFSFSP